MIKEIKEENCASNLDVIWDDSVIKYIINKCENGMRDVREVIKRVYERCNLSIYINDQSTGI